jgi:hypothetical protein
VSSEGRSQPAQGYGSLVADAVAEQASSTLPDERQVAATRQTRQYDPLRGYFGPDGPTVTSRGLERVIAAHAPLCIG